MSCESHFNTEQPVRDDQNGIEELVFFAEDDSSREDDNPFLTTNVSSRFIIATADDVVDSINREELAKSLSINGDPEEEDSEEVKKMETRCDKLVDIFYQKGLALVEAASLKVLLHMFVAVDLFEETFKEMGQHQVIQVFVSYDDTRTTYG